MSAPLQKISVGGISAAIWQNEKNGQTFYSVSLDKRYKTPNNEWKSTASLKPTDLPKAILALQKAYEFVMLSDTNHA